MLIVFYGHIIFSCFCSVLQFALSSSCEQQIHKNLCGLLHSHFLECIFIQSTHTHTPVFPYRRKKNSSYSCSNTIWLTLDVEAVTEENVHYHHLLYRIMNINNHADWVFSQFLIIKNNKKRQDIGGVFVELIIKTHKCFQTPEQIETEVTIKT